MDAEQYSFLVLVVGLLTFFLIRFWYSVDETRKDVKQILINQAHKDEEIKHIKEDLEHLKDIINVNIKKAL